MKEQSKAVMGGGRSSSRWKIVDETCLQVGSWLLLLPGIACTLFILVYSWSDPGRVSLYVALALGGAVSLPCFAGALALTPRSRRAKWQTFSACAGLWISLLVAPWPFQIRFNLLQRTQFDRLATSLRSGVQPSASELQTTGVRLAEIDGYGSPTLYVGGNVSLRHSPGALPAANSSVIYEVLPLGNGWFWVDEE